MAETDLATPLGIVQVVPGNPGTYFLTAADTTRISQNVQQVKLGLNYKIGMDPRARWGAGGAGFPGQGADYDRGARLGIRGGRALLV